MRMTRRTRKAIAGYLFILPNYAGFLTFVLVPIVASFILTFYDWEIISPARLVGFLNYINLMKDGNFWYYVYNTVFLMINIPLGMVLSLCMALLFNQKLRGIVIFRNVYYLPTVTSAVAIAIVWLWLYDPVYGLFNNILMNFGIRRPPDWLGSVALAKPAIMVMGLWASLGGFNTIVYLAALQGIPLSLYEAADIDGATGWQKLRYITIPLLAPATFFILVMGIIEGFQGGFLQAYLMTGGGPLGSTTTISYYIFNNAFVWLRMGYAATISWFLFFVIFVFTLINWRSGGRVVSYY
jgi:multiple sugar transport system permease protein